MSSVLFAKQTMAQLSSSKDGELIQKLLWYIGNNQALSSFGVTFGAAALLFKTGAAASIAAAAGVLQKIAASTNFPALTGLNLATGGKVYLIFYVDALGNLGQVAGAQSTTVGGCTFPVIPLNTAVVGSALLENATNPFVGGTTALDAAGVTLTFGGNPDSILPVSSF